MADVGAESMVGGTTFHREMIQREISRALVLNLSGKASGATALPRIFLSLTAPSLLSRPTRDVEIVESLLPDVLRCVFLTCGRCRSVAAAEQIPASVSVLAAEKTARNGAQSLTRRSHKPRTRRERLVIPAFENRQEERQIHSKPASEGFDTYIAAPIPCGI